MEAVVKRINHSSEIDIIDSEVTEIEAKTETHKINNQDDYALVGEFYKAISDNFKRIEGMRKAAVQPLRDKADDKHNVYKLKLDRLGIAKGKTEALLLDYERKIQEEERKEQALLDAIAEKERLKEEERIKKIALQEEERAKKWAEKGKTDKAEEIRQKAIEKVNEKVQEIIERPVVIVHPKIQKIAGVGTATRWKAEVINIILVPREHMLVDMVKLGKIATASHDTIKIPGIRFYAVKGKTNR